MRRVLVIGLDGADFFVLRKVLSEETIPTIHRLLHRGARADLRSTVPPFTKPAWNSLVTGLNPGKLGMFGLASAGDRGTSVAQTYTGNPYRIWNVVSDQVGSVVVNNVPPIRTADQINGAMVGGGLYQSSSLARDAVYPPEYYTEVRNIGVGESSFREIMKQDARSFLDTLEAYTEANAECARFLLDEVDDWRLCVTVFFGTDQIQHKLWPAIDPDHPEHASVPEWWADEFHEYWSTVDDHIATLLDRTDDETTVLVVSDHGFGPVKERFAINTWLNDEGFLNYEAGGQSQSNPVTDALSAVGLTKYQALRMLERVGLERLQSRIPSVVREMVPSGEGWTPFNRDSVDWDRTRAYSVGSTGAVYLHETPSTTAESTQREESPTREEVRRRLTALEAEGYDVRTWAPEEIYTGPYVDDAPDLLYTIDDMAVMPTPVRNDSVFFYSKTAPPAGAAHHRRDGVLIAAGPDIDSGADPGPVPIFDIAPTVLHLLGSPVPERVDGTPNGGILVEELASRTPDRIELGSLGERDEVSIANLRDLGYL